MRPESKRKSVCSANLFNRFLSVVGKFLPTCHDWSVSLERIKWTLPFAILHLLLKSQCITWKGLHRQTPFYLWNYSALIVKLMKSHKNHLFNQLVNLSHHVFALGIKSIGSTHIHSVISHLMQDPDIVQALRLWKEFKNQWLPLLNVNWPLQNYN